MKIEGWVILWKDSGLPLGISEFHEKDYFSFSIYGSEEDALRVLGENEKEFEFKKVTLTIG